MVQKIDLNRYLLMGGKLENLILERVRCTYSGYEGKKVVAITEFQRNSEDIPLYIVKFDHGVFKGAGMWIETDVLLELAHKYKV